SVLQKTTNRKCQHQVHKLLDDSESHSNAVLEITYACDSDQRSYNRLMYLKNSNCNRGHLHTKGHSSLDMFQFWLMPELEGDYQDFIFQLDRATSDFHNKVRGYLKEYLPQRWISRTGSDDEALLR
ncbi:hypothetical protein NPIL_660051, partial [Nephila pilipes]